MYRVCWTCLAQEHIKNNDVAALRQPLHFVSHYSGLFLRACGVFGIYRRLNPPFPLLPFSLYNFISICFYYSFVKSIRYIPASIKRHAGPQTVYDVCPTSNPHLVNVYQDSSHSVLRNISRKAISLFVTCIWIHDPTVCLFYTCLWTALYSLTFI